VKEFIEKLKRFLVPEEPTPEIREHTAYRLGYQAFERRDGENPYPPATNPHRYWEMGYREAREYWMQVW
jgi:hypothetical protein